MTVADNTPRNRAAEAVYPRERQLKAQLNVRNAVFLSPQQVVGIDEVQPKAAVNCKPFLLCKVDGSDIAAERVVNADGANPFKLSDDTAFTSEHTARNLNADAKSLVFQPLKLPYVGKKRRKNQIELLKCRA